MIEKVIDIAKEASKILLKYYKSDIGVSYKEAGGRSPVTKADFEADAYIRGRLQELFPRDKILSEETENHLKDYSGRVWIVDPLDGTRIYTEGKDGFCVIIGLCIDGVPVLGVVYAPIKDELYYAEKGKGAFLKKGNTVQQIKVSKINVLFQAKAIIKTSKIRESPWNKVAQLKVKENFDLSECGAGIKMAKVAAGEIDFYIDAIFSPCKWDTCGPQIILEEAGGRMTDLSGQPLDYKQQNSKWENPLLVSNGLIYRTVISEAKKLFYEKTAYYLNK